MRKIPRKKPHEFEIDLIPSDLGLPVVFERDLLLTLKVLISVSEFRRSCTIICHCLEFGVHYSCLLMVRSDFNEPSYLFKAPPLSLSALQGEYVSTDPPTWNSPLSRSSFTSTNQINIYCYIRYPFIKCPHLASWKFCPSYHIYGELRTPPICLFPPTKMQ